MQAITYSVGNMIFQKPEISKEMPIHPNDLIGFISRTSKDLKYAMCNNAHIMYSQWFRSYQTAAGVEIFEMILDLPP